MKKQFETKNELEKWINDNFPVKESADFFSFPESPNMKEVAKRLSDEGYDLDDLTANGEAYDVDGHTNNGWFWAYKDELSWLESVGTDMAKVKVRD